MWDGLDLDMIPLAIFCNDDHLVFAGTEKKETGRLLLMALHSVSLAPWMGKVPLLTMDQSMELCKRNCSRAPEFPR